MNKFLRVWTKNPICRLSFPAYFAVILSFLISAAGPVTTVTANTLPFSLHTTNSNQPVIGSDIGITNVFNLSRAVEPGAKSFKSMPQLSASPNKLPDFLLPDVFPTTQFLPYVIYPMTGASAMGVGIGDFNSDGLKDVVVSDGYNGTGIWVFLQQSDGKLALSRQYLAGSRPETLVVGDFNHDGKDDVITGNFGSNTISVYLQTATGTFAPAVSYATSTGPDALAAADLNNDGLLDLAVSHWNAPYLGVFYQQPNGTLGTMVKYPSPQAGWDDIDTGDFNHDGLTDIVKMNGQGYANPNLSVYLQVPGGFAAPVSYDLGNINGDGVAAGDLTGDGWDDIALVYGGNNAYVAIFAQNAAGQLEFIKTYPAYDCPEPVEIADVNLDGRADLLTAHGGWKALSVYYQKTNGSLNPYQLSAIPYATSYGPQGLIIGDINQDGMPDAAIADSNNGLVVLYNALVPDFQMTATPSNQIVEIGKTAQVQVDMTTLYNYSKPVTYTISNLFSGINPTFSTNPVNPPGSTTLYLDVGPSTQTGNDTVKIIGTSGTLSHSIDIVLTTARSITGLAATYDGPTQVGNPTQLQATLTSGSNVSYSWTFGDGVQGSGAIATHTYGAVGHYTATVTAQNELGAVKASVDVEIVDVPIAGLNVMAIRSEQTEGKVDFTASVSQGTNVVYLWDFGDGSSIISNGPTISHIYPATAKYTVTVTASNSQGSLSKTFVVIPYLYHVYLPFIQVFP